MSFEFSIASSEYKLVLGENNKIPIIDRLNVLKNEEFSFQFLIKSDNEFTLIKKNTQDISWVGLCDKLRFNLIAKNENDEDVSEFFETNILDFLSGDNEEKVLDLITKNNSIYSENKLQGIVVSGKFPKIFNNSKVKLIIEIFYTRDYFKEELLYSNSLEINILNAEIPNIQDSTFYLDLWQHPCNWARAYNLEYYSEEHFELIDIYIKEMSKLGQRVCDLIISDYSWAGQRCYKVFENHNNLFELNIVKVFKQNGNIICDFKAMDTYIDICRKYNVLDEINLFGILCNWDAYDFGNPLKDFRDPIRVSYFDKDEKIYKYIENREDLTEYIRQVFNHIYELNLWRKTLIMSDEPGNIELFNQTLDMLTEASDGKKIYLKCAIHNQEFFDKNKEKIKSLSLNTCELVNNVSLIDSLKNQIELSKGKLTWYSCCFPTDLNIFLKSMFIESRISGWFTYYMNMDGFLRWAYGIWPKNVFESASYKKEKWNAGDMFFVCPGKTFEPLQTMRLKNFIYGIQDFVFMKEAEKFLGREFILNKLENVLGKKLDMKFIPEREVYINYSKNINEYEKVKFEIYTEYINIKEKLDKIANAIVDMDEDFIEEYILEAINFGISPEIIYQYGLSEGMVKVTELFENKKYFVSEVIVCADTLNKGVNYLKKNNPPKTTDKAKIILAVVEGDLHEIGKNIVKIMFEASGFEVIDMGLNVKATDIVNKAIQEKADIIGLSTMMTTTMGKMKDVINIIKEMDNSISLPKVIIGGGPIGNRYANEIGAEGYSANAVEAVKLVKSLLKEGKNEF